MGRTQQWIVLVGRLLIGLSFLGAGLATVGTWDETIKMLEGSTLKALIGGQMIPVYLVASILLQTIGGFLVILGARTRLAAMMLAAAVIAKISMVNPFWDLPAASIVRGFFELVTDAKSLGGIFLLLAFGPGRHSVDRS